MGASLRVNHLFIVGAGLKPAPTLSIHFWFNPTVQLRHTLLYDMDDLYVGMLTPVVKLHPMPPLIVDFLGDKMSNLQNGESGEETDERFAGLHPDLADTLRKLEKMANQEARIRDRENVPDDVLQAGLSQYIGMKALAEGEDAEPWDDYEGYLKVVEEVQERMKQKMQDPANRKALDLAQESDDLFWEKRYGECLQKITEAANLDPDYAYGVEATRKAIAVELRKGPVRLTRAINRILYPRLRKLGFRPEYGEDSARWNEQSSQLSRINSHGGEGGMDMGRTKFGKRFALAVWRHDSTGEIERLDLRTVGLAPESLCYLNQAEADAMLERIAEAFEGPILAWLEEE